MLTSDGFRPDAPVALVAGSGHTIGRGVAGRSAAAGTRIVVNDPHDQAAPEETAVLRANGGTGLY